MTMCAITVCDMTICAIFILFCMAQLRLQYPVYKVHTPLNEM